jgi:hypothetical protein
VWGGGELLGRTIPSFSSRDPGLKSDFIECLPLGACKAARKTYESAAPILRDNFHSPVATGAFQSSKKHEGKPDEQPLHNLKLTLRK